MSVTPASEVLAINGGRPVRKMLLPYGRQSVDEDDIQAVVDVLRSDWLTTGAKVGEFEEAFAAWVGAKHAVSFSSGTAALHAAAFAAGLTADDEAITSPMTFAATANCVLYQGGTPVSADVSPDTLNLDPEQTASRVTPRTKVILPVDYAGHPADLEPILEIAERHGLVVIEDACHALGGEYRGRRVGDIAHMTVFSFHPVKHITTGEGGMVTTTRRDFAETLRRFRNHGISSEARQRQTAGQWYYEMVLLGLRALWEFSRFTSWNQTFRSGDKLRRATHPPSAKFPESFHRAFVLTRIRRSIYIRSVSSRKISPRAVGRFFRRCALKTLG
jgi:dTDP-4-amino-4,6-dideoxygalactose transaminase